MSWEPGLLLTGVNKSTISPKPGYSAPDMFVVCCKPGRPVAASVQDMDYNEILDEDF